MFTIHKESFLYGNKEVTIQTGKIARQATGAVEVTIGDTALIATAVVSPTARADASFFPLSVHYQEKTYAAGRIPGSFFRREGRPSEKETLTSRLIDRPIRPLFPKGFLNEVQIVIQVLSLDKDVPTEVPAMLGASAALMLTGAPFDGPIGAAKVGYIDGRLILNPSPEELAESQLDLSIAGTKEAVTMVESEAKQLSEEVMLEAVMFGHAEMQVAIDSIIALSKAAGKPKWDWQPPAEDSKLKEAIKADFSSLIESAYQILPKQERQAQLKLIKQQALEAFSDTTTDETTSSISSSFNALEKEIVRNKILQQKKRIDGRDEDTVREIQCEVPIYPKLHGSALFTRGETQALVAVTLGTERDSQLIDDLEGKFYDKFLFHYNFPAFSVGECNRMMGPGRREIGHGKLAKKAVNAIMPSHEDFPYVIRVVSEITESNGSSSMASVCGASMAMMDAGIPLSAPVAGIAMGLIKEGENFVVLSDIMGDEDHLGDMDFKVAGTEEGITALQMDIKIQGISKTIMAQALQQAHKGRLHILEEMSKAISQSREILSSNAPRVLQTEVPPSRIGDVIGKGGSTIRSIQEEHGVQIDINDTGLVTISGSDQDSAEKAISIVQNLTKDVEVNEIYEGEVIKIVDFGAFISLLPGKDGLLHISEIDHERVNNINDHIQEGDKIKVKVINVDRQGKIRLSRKAIL